MSADTGKPMKAGHVNVLVVVDTAYVKSTYGPNENAAEPRHISSQRQFMVCTGAGAIRAQGSSELRLSANVGDRIAVRVTSICGNADDAVIAYSISQRSGAKVFGRFKQAVVTRAAAVRPDPDSPYRNGLPPIESPVDCSSFESTVIAQGAAELQLAFGLYVISANGQSQNLFGYYAWNPSFRLDN
jgi:hypothetical protein